MTKAVGEMPRSILIADDNPAIRKTLCRIFEVEEDYEVCAEAANDLEAIVRCLVVKSSATLDVKAFSKTQSSGYLLLGLIGAQTATIGLRTESLVRPSGRFESRQVFRDAGFCHLGDSVISLLLQ